MTRDEALDVLAVIMVSWPAAYSWGDTTAAMWVDDLQPLDRAIAMRAVTTCRHTLDFPPSWRQFHEAYAAQAYAARAPERRPVTRGELPAARPVAGGARRARALRELLAAMPARKALHDHHNGATNCPVCGHHDIRPDGTHDPEQCTRCKQLGNDVHAQLGPRT